MISSPGCKVRMLTLQGAMGSMLSPTCTTDCVTDSISICVRLQSTCHADDHPISLDSCLGWNMAVNFFYGLSNIRSVLKSEALTWHALKALSC